MVRSSLSFGDLHLRRAPMNFTSLFNNNATSSDKIDEPEQVLEDVKSRVFLVAADDANNATESSLSLPIVMTDSEVQHDDDFPNQEQGLNDASVFARASVAMLVHKFNNTCTSTAWSKKQLLGSSNNKVCLWKGSTIDSSWKIVRATVTINAEASFLASLLTNPSRMPEIDEMVASATVIPSSLPSHTKYIHVTAVPTFPVTTRDFVVVTTRLEPLSSDGSIIIATRSTEHEDRPEKKGFVRAVMMIAGYILRPTGDDGCSTEATLICQSDLGGNLPATLINAFSTNAPVKLMERIKKVAELESSK